MSGENVELVRRIIRDGRAVRFQWFQSHREALEAAGRAD
jgi:hypothetical protein